MHMLALRQIWGLNEAIDIFWSDLCISLVLSVLGRRGLQVDGSTRSELHERSPQSRSPKVTSQRLRVACRKLL